MRQYEIQENFACNLKEIRKATNKTQTQLGQIFGVTRGNIGAWEERRAMPNLETLIGIAKKYKLTVEDLTCKKLKPQDLA